MVESEQIDRLIDIIKDYADHKEDCQWRQGYDCSCGFGLVQDEFSIDKQRH